MTFKQSINVSMGKAAWSRAPNILSCKGLGSCVAVCLYDELKKTGCMLHILLPQGDDIKKPYLFANTGIKRALEESIKQGMRLDRIWAKVIGGACVFYEIQEDNSIGNRNVLEVKRWLNYFKIPIISEDIGGKEGRSINFYLENGLVEVFTYKRGVLSI